MRNWPQPFWAVILAGMGVALAIAVLLSPHPTTENIRLAVLTIASALVSGALGYIGGHAAASQGTTEVSSTTANPIPPA
jgi:hypothetical protein